MEKKLGKITTAQFGFLPDNNYLFGLILEFNMNGSAVGSSSAYMENISDSAKWYSATQKHKAMTKTMLETARFLLSAKVNTAEELKGKPVEVTIRNGLFKEVRILTEVL